jgi:NifU-like protein involved in Fe-S cluster formation
VSRAETLYSPAVLALATGLAAWPLGDDLPLRGAARSPVCGSRIELGLAADAQGRIERIGLKVHACAIGQASAAIFAGQAGGKDRTGIAEALSAIEHWLANPEGPEPDWPGLNAIAAARGYPARHGAMLLPWKAALAALGG